MRRLEQAAVEAGTSEAQLMAEAGLAVAQEAWLLLGQLEGQSIVALVGPGSNGGDAIIAARHLAEWGATVTCYVARTRRETELLAGARAAGVEDVEGEGDADGVALVSLLQGAGLVIDGLLGIGRQRPIDPEEPIGRTLTALGEARRRPGAPKLIAVDLPTGVDADGGAVDELAVEPDITVTFGLPKVGMYQAPASGRLGRVQVIDIGIPGEAQEAVQLELLTARWARGALPARPETANKGTFGKVLVAGGSRRYIGAPALAARAAYRSGAGLVTIACAEGLVPTLAGSLPEATWLPLDESIDGSITGAAAVALRNEWPGYGAAVIGPGLGDEESTRAFVWAALPDLETLGHGVVLDADALNAMAAMPDAPERTPATAVLTPHPGEMARLLGRTVEEVQGGRLVAAREAAERFGCTVVLKGAHTVIASAGGQTRLSPYANPLLATAGTGDVLAGLIGGYLAQGVAPFEAACLGVYVHAAAGEALREEYGDAGMLAGELAARVASIVREIALP